MIKPLAGCAAALTLLTAPVANAETLLLSVHGIASEQGQVVVQVYDDSKHWMSAKANEMVLQHIVPAAQVKANPKLALPLAYGSYAIQVFHDLDSNGKLKTNFIGIPREPIGTSNNAKGKMGPPKFEDAKFVFDAENTEHALNIVNI